MRLKAVSGEVVLEKEAANPLPTSYEAWGSAVSSPAWFGVETRLQIHFQHTVLRVQKMCLLVPMLFSSHFSIRFGGTIGCHWQNP